MKWSEKEESELIRLRQANVPYREKIKYAIFKDRTQDALRNKMLELRNREKLVSLDQECIGVFDIETSDLNADVGYMLGWAVYYPHEDRVVSDIITKKDITNYTLDKRICKSLLKEFKNIDILMGYFSTRFDIPYFRTRCLMNGLKGFPGYGTMRHIDCFYFARGKVKTRRKSMGIVAEALGLQEKTHEPLPVWNKARLGDGKSLAKLRSYNENDVIVTWQIYNELLKYGKYTSKSI